jgi:small nuclear ribonucleoprotein (snRNP)-like protein
MNVLKARLRKTVIATLKDGSSFRGVLYQADRTGFVLRNVEHLDVKTSRATPVDGEIFVLPADVSYLQVL